MTNRKPLFWLAIVVVAALAAYFYRTTFSDVSSPKSGLRPRLALIVGGPDPYWQEVIFGAQEAAKEFDADLQVEVPDGTRAGQTASLVKAIANNNDGVAISPLAPNEQTRMISALAAKIKVVTYDNDAPNSIRHLYIGSHNTSAGRMAAELVLRALPEGGKIALFVGDNERQNARERRQALISTLRDGAGAMPKADDEKAPLDQPIEAGVFTIVATYLDDSDPRAALANSRQALQEHPDLAGMVALYSYNGPACLEALKEAGKLGQVKVVAFDEHDETIAGVEEGTVTGTVVQDPYLIGHKAVEELCRLCRGKISAVPLMGSGSMFLQCSIVDKDNVAQFKENVQKRLADRG